ncbi:MAG TPA: hypothetical protein VFA52_00325 [Candidatus Paceibacterota bacterium]|nr:hypothetical protein [Candidatus Paceibacterota bacterium]
MKQKNVFLLIGTIVILILLGWFIGRPAIAAHQCDKKSYQRVQEIKGDRIDYEYFYRRCLRSYGIQIPITDKLLG